MFTLQPPRHIPSSTSELVLAGDSWERQPIVRKAGEAFIKTWPIAGIGLAVAVNGIWIAALGYGISKLF